MARNIEIKARLAGIPKLLPKVAALATGGPEEIDQDDTFFRCADGRLKLRAFSEDRGELIFYRRADRQGPKESYYLIAPTAAPGALRRLLAQANGETGRVVKHRTVYLVGRTRVHLDRVEGLGDFLELEVVLRDDEDAAAGIAEAHALMERLGVRAAQLVEGAYIDLQAARNAHEGKGT
ncbi:MAG: class IV adenylate cyclase [bacterium]|nr:class IV adenylate cyclase [bacterium]